MRKKKNNIGREPAGDRWTCPTCGVPVEVLRSYRRRAKFYFTLSTGLMVLGAALFLKGLLIPSSEWQRWLGYYAAGFLAHIAGRVGFSVLDDVLKDWREALRL